MKDGLLFTKLEKKEIMKMPSYYREMLLAFQEIHSYILRDLSTKDDIYKQPLFRNCNFDIDIPNVFNHIFETSNFVTIFDIMYDVIPGFFPTEAIIDIIQEKYPDMYRSKIANYYSIILQAIPENWTKRINNSQYEKSVDS